MAAAAIHFQILHNKGLPHIPPLIAAIVWEITMRKNLIYFKQIWSDSYKTNLTFFISTVLRIELESNGFPGLLSSCFSYPSRHHEKPSAVAR